MLNGNGFFIWNIPNCEGGDVAKIVKAAVDAGLKWVAVKIADGESKSNRPYARGIFTDLIKPLVVALHAVSIQCWGWHYVYGYSWQREAATATDQIRDLGLDGYIIDAEQEYKLAGRAAVATAFMGQMRAAYPALPMALCSYRFPSLHPELPWDAFLSKCDLNMPQVYWEDAHNACDELTQCVVEFNARKIRRPIIPIGPTYKRGKWAPTLADIKEFESAAAILKLPGLGYFSWDECRRDLPGLWPPKPVYHQYLPFVDNGPDPSTMPPGPAPARLVDGDR
jgi:hypothetical protein